MSTRTLNIMVVDDSAITIKKLTKMIEGLGHKVTCSAKTGQAAIDIYRGEKPDLVTMDITMPDMDGIQAAKGIISEDENALIIMVTSHGQEQMVMDAIDAGAKGYVLKPVRPEKLKESIDKVADKFLA